MTTFAPTLFGAPEQAESGIPAWAILPNSIRTYHIANLSVTNAKIADATIESAKIASLSADKITAGQITVLVEVGAEGRIDLDGANNVIVVSDATPVQRVKLGKIGADYGLEIYNAAGSLMWSLASGAQTPGIGDSQVTNVKIASMTVDKLTAGNLTVTVELTSGKIRTAATGARVELDSAGVRLYDSGGIAVVNLDTATGAGTFKGTISSGSEIIGAKFWAPQKTTGVLRLIVESAASWTGGLVWAMPADTYGDNTTWSAFLTHNQISVGAGTHWGNDIIARVWGGNKNAGGIADETTNHDANAAWMLMSGVPLEAFTTDNAPYLLASFSHRDNAGTPVTRTGQVKFRLLGDLLVEAIGLSRARDLVQAGTDTMTGDGTAVKSKAITFPQAFATTPVVVAISNSSQRTMAVTARSIDGCTIEARQHDEGNWSNTITFFWIAIGGDA